MKLSKLDITNFRCFESQSILLHPDVNVIVGINGSGKTAILDVIAIAFFRYVKFMSVKGGFKEPEQPTLLRPSDVYSAPESNSVETGLKNSVRFQAQAQAKIENGYRDPTHTDTDHQILDWSEEISYDPPNWHTNLLKSPLADYYRQVWDLLRNTPKSTTPIPVIAYYHATRRISKMPEMGDIFKLRMDRASAFDNALDAGADYQSMCQWFYLRENQELREKRDIDKTFELPDLKAVRQALFTMIENIERIFFDGMPPTLKMALTLPGQTTPNIMTLEQLSDGYRNMLALVLDFARRLALANPYWENPLTAPGILLIDEIDLHLHPKWQQRVIPDLRKVFPNTQIIVTTHSPQILTTVKPENILLLKNQTLSSPQVSTYGTESSHTLLHVMETASRPDNEVSTAIKQLFHLIDQGKFAEAAQECGRLKAVIGYDEPVLFEAETIIKNRVWEQELGL